MFGILIIFAVLGALIFLAYRGVSLLILAPALAILAVAATRDGPVLASYTQIFMEATGGFIVQFFPIFLLGAVFGKLLEDSGSAEVMASSIIRVLGEHRAILAVVLSCAVMTYGGVSLFVVAFAIYPIATSLFRNADIPKRLIPATVALGAFSFTMTALPGTPAIQNTIPMPFFGTSAFAAPGLGIIAALVMFGFGMWWLTHRAKALAHEGYGAEPASLSVAVAGDPLSEDSYLRERAAGEGFDLREVSVETEPVNLPGPFVAIMPLFLVIGLNLLFTFSIIPRMDAAFLALPEFGSTTIDDVRGIWAVIAALASARNPDRHRPQLAATATAHGEYRFRCERFAAADLQYGQPGRLRCGNCFHVSVCSDPRRCLGSRRRQSADFTRGCHQRSGRHDRFGLRRPEHCTFDPWRYLPAIGRSKRHQPGASAPGSGDRDRRTRHAAAQWRSDHAAGDLRIDPQAVLSRPRDGCGGGAVHRARRNHRAGDLHREFLKQGQCGLPIDRSIAVTSANRSRGKHCKA
uniref:GntP family permease n=1 Tax=Mesorhizobium xinjiangense TaxID=2678685 RepID=UPI002E26A550